MNEVRCSGFEKSVTECQFNKDALGCSHEEDAAVRCNVPAMGFQETVSPTRNANGARTSVSGWRAGWRLTPVPFSGPNCSCSPACSCA